MADEGARTGRDMNRVSVEVDGEAGAERRIRVIRHVAALVLVRPSTSMAGGSEALLVSSRKHPGQRTLPKGGWEEDETLVAAALREAFEEAGLRTAAPAVVDAVSQLHLESVVVTDHPAEKAKVPSYAAVDELPVSLVRALTAAGLAPADVRSGSATAGFAKASGCTFVTRFHALWLVLPAPTADEELLLTEFPEARDRERTWLGLWNVNNAGTTTAAIGTSLGVKPIFVDMLQRPPVRPIETRD
jgi:8-oxo-dGTP pyrophosphatase MutT (NUDIX family)